MNLITDRTQADLERLYALQAKAYADMSSEEKAEWNGGPRGGYCYIDLNRVGEAVEELTARLTAAGISVSTAPKTDWTEADIPTPAQQARYIADIAAIRAALPVLTTTPETPARLPFLTLGQANDIEQILFDVGGILDIMAVSGPVCGDAYCGGDYL